MKLLKLYTGKGIKIVYVAPKSLQMPVEIVEEVARDTDIEQVCHTTIITSI